MNHTGKICENYYFCIIYDTFYSTVNGIKVNVQFFFHPHYLYGFCTTSHCKESHMELFSGNEIKGSCSPNI